jgi:hypothetical protein
MKARQTGTQRDRSDRKVEQVTRLAPVGPHEQLLAGAGEQTRAQPEPRRVLPCERLDELADQVPHGACRAFDVPARRAHLRSEVSGERQRTEALGLGFGRGSDAERRSDPSTVLVVDGRGERRLDLDGVQAASLAIRSRQLSTAARSAGAASDQAGSASNRRAITAAMASSRDSISSSSQTRRSASASEAW